MHQPHEHTVDAARQAAANDELNDWVCDFLSSPGSDNAPLACALTDPPRHWAGPVLVPIEQLQRLAGPPGDPVLVEIDDEEWAERVDDMAEKVAEGWELPPVIVTHDDGTYQLEDGNHRVESLRRAGETEAWAVINFRTPEERDLFTVEALGADTEPAG